MPQVLSAQSLTTLTDWFRKDEALVAVLLFLGLYLLVLSFFLFRNYLFHKKLFGTSKEDLKGTLRMYLKELGETKTALQEAQRQIDELKDKEVTHLQKVGLVRFNPFEDTGSDQSFSLVLMDERGNGYVISSLHGRDRSRLYCKPIKNEAEVGYPFSKEEKEAIVKAKEFLYE